MLYKIIINDYNKKLSSSAHDQWEEFNAVGVAGVRDVLSKKLWPWAQPFQPYVHL